MVTDNRLVLTEAAFGELGRFLKEPKFLEVDFYPGAPEDVRDEVELHLNNLIVRLINGLGSTPTKEFVLAEIRGTLEAFDKQESEEQDQLVVYLSRLLDILGVTSTDGLIGTWRYGCFEAANDP